MLRGKGVLVVAVMVLLLAGSVWAASSADTVTIQEGQQTAIASTAPGQGPVAAGHSGPDAVNANSLLEAFVAAAAHAVQLPGAYLVLGATLLGCAGLLRKVTG